MITKRNMTSTRRALSLLRTLTILALAVPILNSTAVAQTDLQQDTLGYRIADRGIMDFQY